MLIWLFKKELLKVLMSNAESTGLSLSCNKLSIHVLLYTVYRWAQMTGVGVSAPLIDSVLNKEHCADIVSKRAAVCARACLRPCMCVCKHMPSRMRESESNPQTS